MRTMMFDEVNLPPLASHNSLGGECLTYLRNPGAVGSTGSEARPPMWSQCDPQQFVLQMRLGIAGNRYMVWCVLLGDMPSQQVQATPPSV